MKLPNGYGSVYKLSGNRRNPWVARKTTGFKLVPEKKRAQPIYHIIGYYPNRKSALTALAEYNADPTAPSKPKALTVAEAYEKWSESKFPKIAQGTIKNYRNGFAELVELHDKPIKSLSLDDIQDALDRRNKYTPSMRKVKVVLGNIFEWAMIHGHISKEQREIVKYVDVDKYGSPNARDAFPFTDAEIDFLWKHQGEKLAPDLILILLYTGMRIEEFISLRPEDVDMTKRLITVSKSKTNAGYRVIPISSKIYPVIEQRKQDSGPSAFVSGRGNPLTYDGAKFAFNTYLDEHSELNSKHTLHHTRHTFISHLTNKKTEERFVKQLVGHSQGKNITIGTYTHFDVDTLREYVELV